MMHASSITPDQTTETSPKKPGMSTRHRILFFVTAWFIAFMPVMFWWNTWFGRTLSEKQVAEYLRDDRHPRHIQHALVQVGERMSRHDAAVALWYPELVRLAAHPVDEVRNTDAWVLGQDTSGQGFHDALLKLLNDQSPLVRGNAALSLVRYGDATGREQIVALLQPVTLTAPFAGRVVDADKAGTAIHQGGLIAKLQNDQQTVEVRSPIAGRIRTLFVQTGGSVKAGAEIATVDPAVDQVWEALRALYLVGQPDDLPAIARYERDLPEVPDHIRQQALLTDKAIRDRAGH
ncbi:MAG TPA: biotin/lipoyl-containing protein [Terriglobales bacterium]|nr:biotin/lipoyl-containing protein [Terriglobales bacterium]